MRLSTLVGHVPKTKNHTHRKKGRKRNNRKVRGELNDRRLSPYKGVNSLNTYTSRFNSQKRQNLGLHKTGSLHGVNRTRSLRNDHLYRRVVSLPDTSCLGLPETTAENMLYKRCGGDTGKDGLIEFILWRCTLKYRSLFPSYTLYDRRGTFCLKDTRYSRTRSMRTESPFT